VTQQHVVSRSYHGHHVTHVTMATLLQGHHVYHVTMVTHYHVTMDGLGERLSLKKKLYIICALYSRGV